MESYLVPAGYGTDELVEKRSRFIGQVWPVETEEEARARVEETKKKYHDARHNCWCYILRGSTLRYADDGEPQGTAGQPMLNVFQREAVENVCCVVTRYFGGILLGAGGLVRAYSAAAKLALDAAGIARMAQWDRYLLGCAYPLYERVRRLCEAHGCFVAEADFGADVSLEILVRTDVAERFLQELREMSNAAVTVEPAGSTFQGLVLDRPSESV